MLSLRDRHAFWLLQAAGWTAFGLVYTLAEIRCQHVFRTVLSNVVCTFAGFLASLLLWRVYRRFSRVGVSTIPLAVAGSCAGTIVWYVIDKLGLRLAGLVSWDAPWLHWNDPLLNQYFLLTLAGVLLAWSALYFGLIHARELDAERERAILSRTLAREAQLRALQYQLNPHFLYNVLNGISTLVAEGESATAGAMIARLAEFLRATLDDQAPEVSLERELTLIDKYLAIERLRFGDRLTVDIEVAADVVHARVPTLLLQPLVENAVRHGVARRREGGRILVSAERKGDRLCLGVRDNGPGWGQSVLQMGVGLRNVQERLNQLFEGDHVFELVDQPSGGAEIRVEVPLRAA